MVSAAKRANLVQSRVLPSLNHRHLVYVVTLRHIFGILRLLVMTHAQRNALSDAIYYLVFQNVRRNVAHLPVCLYGAHSAADVNSHGIGNNGVFACQNSAYWHSLSSVHIGHYGKVVEEERQGGEVLNLLHCRCLNIIRPNLYYSIIYSLNFHNFVLFLNCDCKITGLLRSLFA